MIAAIPKILAALPTEWRGTTFKNHALLGRWDFCEQLTRLITSQEDYTEADLVGIGNAEDYLRVASNVSTTLELTLARTKGMNVDQVWSFGSKAMPIIAVLLTAGKTPVKLFTGDEGAFFLPAQMELLAILGANLTQETGVNTGATEGINLALESALPTGEVGKLDGVVGDSLLFIHNQEKILAGEIAVIRKRMSTPLTTPVALAMLQELAGLPDTATKSVPSAVELTEFYTHLQAL